MADPLIVRELVDGEWVTTVGSSGGGGGGVSEITSTDMSITVTDPTGPTVDLSASGGSQAVGCVLVASSSLDLATGSALYFTWDQILDNPYDANEIEALPGGLGIDPSSIGTDTLTTTEAGVWAFTANRISIPPDANWDGSVAFGNFNLAVLQDLGVQATGSRSYSTSAIYNLPSGAGFSLGILTNTPPAGMSLDAAIGGLIVVRLA